MGAGDASDGFPVYEAPKSGTDRSRSYVVGGIVLLFSCAVCRSESHDSWDEPKTGDTERETETERDGETPSVKWARRDLRQTVGS